MQIATVDSPAVGLTIQGALQMRNILTFTAISAIALFASSSAFASTVLFNITGPDTISFTVDQSPTPDFVHPGFFRLNANTVTLNGIADRTNFFFRIDGRLDLAGLGFYFRGSTPYFSGGTATPTFLTGNYRMLGIKFLDFSDPSPDFVPTGGEYRLTISQVAPVAPVPEPATWAMMLAGFAGIGMALRRSRQGRSARPQVA